MKKLDTLLANLIETAQKKKLIDAKFCKLLHEAYNTTVATQDEDIPFWKYAGCASWDDLVITKLGITPSRAKRYIAIQASFGEELVTHPPIELKKLELLLPVVTDTNAHELVVMARTSTTRELKASIQETLGLEETVTRSFKLTREEDSLLTEALSILTGHSKQAALVLILQAFLTSKEAKKAKRAA